MSFEAESVRFIHFQVFDREWMSCGLSDDDLRFLQNQLAADPRQGPVVKGTGGLRKVRFAPSGSGRGKRGSYRVGYVYLSQRRTVVLATVWGKNEKADISAAERSALAQAIAALKRALGPDTEHE